MFPIFCAICNWEEQSLFDLEVHLLKKHRDFLKKRFSRNQPKQTASEKTTEATGSSAFTQKCETCSVVFHSKWSFRKHIRTAHAFKNSFSCAQCQKSFLTQAGLNRHRSQVHKQAEAQEYQVPDDDDDDIEVLEVSTEFASVDAAVTGKALKANPRTPKNLSKKDRSVFNLSKLISVKQIAPVSQNQNRKPSLSPQSGVPKPVSVPIKAKQISKLSPPPEKRTKTENRRESVVVVNSTSAMDAINSNKTSPPTKLSPNQGKPQKSFVINCTKCNSAFPNATMLVTHIKAVHLS